MRSLGKIVAVLARSKPAHRNLGCIPATMTDFGKCHFENRFVQQSHLNRTIFNLARQSPIDIHLSHTTFDPSLSSNPLTICYPEKMKEPAIFENTGSTWKVRVNDDRFRISGGPLKDTYQLDQFHAHWGRTDFTGSEHMIDHHPWAGEIHFVHWNTTKCKSPAEALVHPDGLAVFGIFLKAGKSHPELEKLTNLVGKIHYKGQQVKLDNIELDIRKILPRDLEHYFTYDGSLTTAPYDDCVEWIVFKDHIELSHEQLEAMRSLVCHQAEEPEEDTPEHPHGHVIENFRQVQETTVSKIRSSFKCC